MWYVVCVKDLDGNWNYLTTSNNPDEEGKYKLMLSPVYPVIVDKDQWCERTMMAPIGRPFVTDDEFRRARELVQKSGAVHFMCTAREYIHAEHDPLKIIDGETPHPGAVYSRLEGF